MINLTAKCTLITSLLSCSVAMAQSYWTTESGFWHVPFNWDTGVVPTETDIAAALTYTRNAFGNDKGDMVQPRTITRIKNG